MKVRMPLLEQKYASRVFLALLRHPKGLTSYDFSKLSKQKTESQDVPKIGGKAIQILRPMKGEGLVSERKIVRGRKGKKNIYTVNFDGLVETINALLPKKLGSKEKELLKNILSSTNWSELYPIDLIPEKFKFLTALSFSVGYSSLVKNKVWNIDERVKKAKKMLGRINKEQLSFMIKVGSLPNKTKGKLRYLLVPKEIEFAKNIIKLYDNGDLRLRRDAGAGLFIPIINPSPVYITRSGGE